MFKSVLVGLLLLLLPSFGFAADPTLPTSDADITTGWFELGACTVSGCTQRTVSDRSELDTAITNAVCGDEIVLDAGLELDVSNNDVVFTDKNCTDSEPIIVRSAGEASLDAKGVRIGGGSQPVVTNMATLSRTGDGTGDQPIIRIDQAADNWWFVGLEVKEKNTTTATTPSAQMIRIGYDGSSNCGTGVNQANRIIFERVYVHGTTTGGTHDGFVGCVGEMAIIDSYIDEIHDSTLGTGDGGHGIQLFNSDGPSLFQNTYWAITGINFFLCGNTCTDRPTDVTFRRNHVLKYTKWDDQTPGADYAGINWITKNLWETKGSLRVLVEDNLFEHHWLGDSGQRAALVFKASSGLDASHLTFRYNTGFDLQVDAIIINADSGSINDLLIEQSLFYESSTVNLARFWLGGGSNGITNVTIRHVTAMGHDSTPVMDWVAFHETQNAYGATTTVQNNIFDARGSSGCFSASGQGCGNTPWEWAVSNSGADGLFSNNVAMGGASGSWNTGTYFTGHSLTSLANMDFAGDTTLQDIPDFDLLATSPHYAGEASDATDDTDMGVDIDTLTTKMGCTSATDCSTMSVETGSWAAAPASLTWPGVTQGQPSWSGVVQGGAVW